MASIDVKKLLHMHHLIHLQCTGCASAFALKVELSRSRLYDYLNFLRQELGVEVVYNKYRQTYEYGDQSKNDLMKLIHCRSCPFSFSNSKDVEQDKTDVL